MCRIGVREALASLGVRVGLEACSWHEDMSKRSKTELNAKSSLTLLRSGVNGDSKVARHHKACTYEGRVT